MDRIGELDGLDGPVPKSGDGLTQLLAGIAAINKDVAQSGIERSDRGWHRHGAIAFDLLAGGGNKSMVDPLKGLVPCPGIKAALHGGVRCELPRKLESLAASGGEIT